MLLPQRYVWSGIGRCEVSSLYRQSLKSDVAQLMRVSADQQASEQLTKHSPLGRILVALSAADVVDLEVARETVLGSVAHDLETYLTALGIIALITPLLGILGTVVGMIDVFTSVVSASGDTAVLAGGISTALITTAAGLSIAIRP